MAVLDGVAAHALPIVAIWPNADAGGRAIARRLEASSATFASLYQSLPHDEYICLLRGAAAIVGNSSSGIIEAPLLATPAVNVGDRQAGRERGDNVIDVPADAGAVRDGIARALIPDFRARLSGVSPYGDGHAAGRIADELLRTSIDDRLLGRDD